MNLFLVSSKSLSSLLLGVIGFFLLTVIFIHKAIENIELDYNDDVSAGRRHSRNNGRGGVGYGGGWSRFRGVGGVGGNQNSYQRGYIHTTSTNIHHEHVVDPDIVKSIVQNKLRLPYEIDTLHPEDMSYDIHECPETIPDGYPMNWNIIDVLSYWNPDQTDIPSNKKIHQGLCELDWSDIKQRQIAEDVYRKYEMPFILKNHPIVWETAERWSSKQYLQNQLKDEKFRNEYSKNNHLMYWKYPNGKKSSGPKGWEPPTENVQLTYDEWYEKAQQLQEEEEEEEESNNNNSSSTTNKEHWYFRLNGDLGKNGKGSGRNEFLFDELPIFDPRLGSTMFMVDTNDARGINCRFGPRGSIAETHYDFSRNWILILQGQKRYILAHPNQCQQMELHDMYHPSARHSRINWSDPNDWNTGKFKHGQVSEVVLQAGDLLYLPTAWFHFIVSLNFNYQCNARSGITYENSQHIRDCGFPPR